MTLVNMLIFKPDFVLELWKESLIFSFLTLSWPFYITVIQSNALFVFYLLIPFNKFMLLVIVESGLLGQIRQPEKETIRQSEKEFNHQINMIHNRCLWRINLVTCVESSTHHSNFNFFLLNFLFASSNMQLWRNQ